MLMMVDIAMMVVTVMLILTIMKTEALMMVIVMMTVMNDHDCDSMITITITMVMIVADDSINMSVTDMFTLTAHTSLSDRYCLFRIASLFFVDYS